MTYDVVINILSNYGLPMVLVLFTGYMIWTKVIPYIITQLTAQQDYLFGEIKRLQEEAREDKHTLMDLVKQGNENTLKLQGTLEKINNRLDTLSVDVSEVYKMVARDKKLINGSKEHYPDKE